MYVLFWQDFDENGYGKDKHWKMGRTVEECRDYAYKNGIKDYDIALQLHQVDIIKAKLDIIQKNMENIGKTCDYLSSI